MDGTENSISVAISHHFEYLQGIFPKANCTILLRKCRELGDDEDSFRRYVEQLLEDPSPLYEIPPEDALPPAEDTLFDVEAFLNMICTKDPVGYYENLVRTEIHKNQMIVYLKNKFLSYSGYYIEQILIEHDFNLLDAFNNLVDSPPPPLMIPRSAEEVSSPLSPHLINEIKFVENFKSIESFVSLREEIRLVAQAEERCLQCECCFSDDLIEDEVKSCTEGHLFCYNCVKKYIEVKLGEAQVKFPCMATCQGSIPMGVIKGILSEKIYAKLCNKIQEAEVKSANIGGIEFCPVCEYCCILDEHDPFFDCLVCKIKFCRLCRKEYHAPLKCDESVAERERIIKEEEATFQVLRICKKCNSRYIKYEGCNIVMCSMCGTTSCYICSTILGQNLDVHLPFDHVCKQ